MEKVLEVRGLTRRYPSFLLDHVSFSVEKGKITGFIGRNGAGKSTTLGTLFGFVHPDEGEIRFKGKNIKECERQMKQQIGYVAGGIDYYPKKKIRVITKITRAFYENWNEEAYRRYLSLFELDEEKTPSELSEGMKVKYALTLALSHEASLLVLDEPTSGLDPVSRAELLNILKALCNEGKTILFSTHIISDLEKCADNIIYIRKGKIVAENSIHGFIGMFAEQAEKSELEEIMIYLEKKGGDVEWLSC